MVKVATGVSVWQKGNARLARQGQSVQDEEAPLATTRRNLDPFTIMAARTIAIGDIHGCSRALDALLDAIQPLSEDELVILGDVVNRGPDSKGVLDRLLELERLCRLVCILGNHDEMFHAALCGRHRVTWMGMGGGATIDSYGPGRDVVVVPEEHVELLRRFVSFYETDTHIFTHGNYLPAFPMRSQPGNVLRWESLRDRTPGPHGSGKTVIVGHTSQKDGEILDLGHVVCIDTFCHGGGWLTALEVSERRVWQADLAGRLREATLEPLSRV